MEKTQEAVRRGLYPQVSPRRDYQKNSSPQRDTAEAAPARPSIILSPELPPQVLEGNTPQSTTESFKSSAFANCTAFTHSRL